MVGAAVSRRLQSEGCTILTADRQKLDLRDNIAVRQWMTITKPDVVILSAAKVGGIHANNTFPVDFLQDNLMIQNSVISGAHIANVERLLFLGSSCIYPKNAAQPITENALLTGSLEPTNAPYAVAKIAGITLVEAYRRQYGHDWISAMPTNLYGPGDNYHSENSHVLPALLRRFHEAKMAASEELIIWGSGLPKREFMHVDDLADALVFLLKHYSDDKHINVGSGQETTIADLAQIIGEIVGCNPTLVFDTSKRDGMPRKLLDSSKLKKLGWDCARSLREGITSTYEDFLSQKRLNQLRE